MTEKTVDGAYARIEAHEDLCAERYQNIHSTLAELKTGQASHGKAAWGIVLALLGWMAVQLWQGGPHTQPAPVTVATAN